MENLDESAKSKIIRVKANDIKNRAVKYVKAHGGPEGLKKSKTDHAVSKHMTKFRKDLEKFAEYHHKMNSEALKNADRLDVLKNKEKALEIAKSKLKKTVPSGARIDIKTRRGTEISGSIDQKTAKHGKEGLKAISKAAGYAAAGIGSIVAAKKLHEKNKAKKEKNKNKNKDKE
jgi:hypothetical protein